MTILFDDAPQLISHNYTYFITDLRNNKNILELPLQNVSYENKLSDIGEATASIQINDDTAKYGLKHGMLEGKTGLYVVRDGIPVWGGIIWKTQYSDQRTLNLTAKTFESYFDKRYQRKTKYWANTDQFEMARWLVADNGSADAVGITVDTSNSGVLRERAMFYYEFKRTGEELSQLANLINGFDFNVVIGTDTSGAFTRRLSFWYPQAGVSLANATSTFEYPGNIRTFTLTNDSENAATHMYAIGAGEGTEQLVQDARDIDAWNQGLPELEESRSYNSVVKLTTLQSHADKDLERLKSPISLIEFSVRGDHTPEFGSYGLGDYVKVKIADLYLSPALQLTVRITGIKVSVDTSTGLEDITIITGGDDERAEDEGLD